MVVDKEIAGGESHQLTLAIGGLNEQDADGKWVLSLMAPLRIVRGTVEIDSFGSNQAAMILALLAIRRAPMSRVSLMAILWPGECLRAARPRLRQELYRLTKSLGSACGCLRIGREHVELIPDRFSTDVDALFQLSCAPSHERLEERISRLSKAAALYKRGLLMDSSEHWVEVDRTIVRLKVRDVLLELAEALLEAGQATEAREFARRGAKLGRGDERSLAVLETACRAAEPQKTQCLQHLNLPIQTHTLVGRELEITQIQESLLTKDCRLLSITAFGGMGKTHLAVELAARICQQMPVYFVSLIEVESPEVLLQRIYASICRPDQALLDPWQAILEAVGKERTLLIMDNLEELSSEGAQLIRELLERIPKLVILVTTRKPLGLLFEQVFPLAPLPCAPPSIDEFATSAGIELFLQHHRLLRPEFDDTAEARHCIARIVAEVQGIPLAIVLAASRIRDVSLRGVEEAFQRDLGVTGDPDDTLEPRHRTMRACIEWSTEPLTDHVRDFWMRLGVFHGGWTLLQARKILDEPLALDYLEELCDSSLVFASPSNNGTRYGMFEPIRQFVVAERDASVLERDSRAHANYFADWVNSHAAELMVQRPFAEIDPEQDNIRAALEWGFEHDTALAQAIASDMRSYWCQDGHYAEARLWFTRVLALPRNQWDLKLRSRVLFSSAMIEIDQGRYAKGKELLESCKDTVQNPILSSEVGWVELNIAYADFMLGDLVRANEYQEQGLARFTANRDAIGRAHALADLGITRIGLGQSSEGLQLLHLAMHVSQEQGYANGSVYSQAMLGRGYVLLGQFEEAMGHLLKARSGAEAIREVRVLAEVVRDIAFCKVSCGVVEEAEVAIREMQNFCHSMDNRLELVRSQLLAAKLSIAQGNSCGAMWLVRDAIHSCTTLESEVPLWEAFDVGAHVLLGAGRHRESLIISLAARRLMRDRGVTLWPTQSISLEACGNSARLALKLDEIEQAASLAEAATTKQLADIFISG